MNAAAQYLALTKPRLLPLVLFSGLPALVMAAGEWPPLAAIAAILVGTSLTAGAANALNSYLERERDGRMERTAARPLPSGRMHPAHALIFGLALGVLGTALLWVAASPMAALIGLAALLFYVFVYTLWLKPRTPFAVVVGGVSGAIAPLIADAALDGAVGAAGLILFALIFLWQPPHFYAIALYRKEDYARAGFPMLHDRIGEPATRLRILLWIAALLPVSLLPLPLGLLGAPYAVAALLLGAGFLAAGVALWRRPSALAARRLFLVSLLYLMGTFAAMIVDLAWKVIA
jgi:protoheme IX farnesyltransferase